MEGRFQIVAVATVAVVVILAAVAIVVVPRLTPSAPPASGQGLAHVSVRTDHPSYLSEQTINITVRVDNVGGAPLRLNFSGTCQASYQILDAGGGLVYQPSSESGCGSVDTNLTLPPGGFKEYQFTWDQLTAHGWAALAPYRVRGTLLAQGPSPPLTAETDILIEFGTTLGFAASLDSLIYHLGDVANVTVTLTNTGPAPAVLHFGDPCYDQFLVSSEGLGTVFNSSFQSGCVQVLAYIVLNPGESTTRVFMWNLQTDAGTPLTAGRSYTVTPGFAWYVALSYQRSVTSTQEAFFFLGS